MKNLILILFVSFGVSILSQTTKKEDTTEICIPYKVGKQIMIDLNKLDSTSAILKLTKDEVVELNKKIEVQKSIIITIDVPHMIEKNLIRILLNIFNSSIINFYICKNFHWVS